MEKNEFNIPTNNTGNARNANMHFKARKCENWQ